MRNDVVVEKMIRLIEKLEKYCENITYEEFEKNEMLTEACIFNISQLGELTRKIDEKFEEEHPQIPWRQLYGLRNRIVHDYDRISNEILYIIATERLGDFELFINDILSEF